MATCFDRWEKDPFFSAAEEVQESTDRMESVYRRWMSERKDGLDSSQVGNDGENSSGELLRELQTALGTAKWQLEVLEKAVRSNEEACLAGEDTRSRHKDFFNVIGNQISKVEKSVVNSSSEDGNAKVKWVQLDDGERDELALFLSLPPLPKQPNVVVNGTLATKEDKRKQGHRRTASANADIGSWSISVSSEDIPGRSVVDQPVLPPPKIASFSCLTKALEPTSNIKWSNYGFRNWTGEQHHSSELIPLKNSSQDTDSCYDKSKNCFNICHDEHYNKQLHGWVGALQRLLQRSQYHIQYGRPIQMICWTMVVILCLVLVALRAI